MEVKGGLKSRPFWVKAIITVGVVFILSEIGLRMFGYTGVISLKAMNILLDSSKRLILLMDNLLLFFIIILIPIFLTKKLLEKVPKKPIKYKVKGSGPLYNSKISVEYPKKNLQYLAEGRGLAYGSAIAIVYNLIDFFLIKRFIPECESYCGFENLFGLVGSIIYLIIGIFLIKKSEVIDNKI